MHAPPNHRRELEAAAIAAAQQAEIARDEANHALKAKDALAKGRKNRHSTSGGDLFVKGGANATPQQVAWNKLRSNVHGAFPYLENALTGNENFVPLPPTAHPPPNPQLPSTTRHASSNPAVVVMPHHAHSDRGVVHRSSLPPPTIPPIHETAAAHAEHSNSEHSGGSHTGSGRGSVAHRGSLTEKSAPAVMQPERVAVHASPKGSTNSRDVSPKHARA